MLKRKTWEEFRKTGLLWWINSMLHLMGWAIVYEIENEKVKEVYPARVKFRGFSEENTTQGYISVSKYLDENATELYKEAKS